MSEDYQNRVVHSVQWRFDPITGEPLSAALVPLTQRPAAQTEREADGYGITAPAGGEG